MPVNEETTMSISFFFTVLGIIATVLYTYFSDKNNVTKLNERITNINDSIDSLTNDTEKKYTDFKTTFNEALKEIKDITKEREDALDENLENFKSKNAVEMIELKKNINDERIKTTEAFFKRIDELRDNLKHIALEVTELSTKIVHLEKNTHSNEDSERLAIKIAVIEERLLNIKELFLNSLTNYPTKDQILFLSQKDKKNETN